MQLEYGYFRTAVSSSSNPSLEFTVSSPMWHPMDIGWLCVLSENPLLTLQIIAVRSSASTDPTSAYSLLLLSPCKPPPVSVVPGVDGGFLLPSQLLYSHYISIRLGGHPFVIAPSTHSLNEIICFSLCHPTTNRGY